MSDPTLSDTLTLLRKVLALETRQGYRNTAATGGLRRYFEHQFGRHDYSGQDAIWDKVQAILRGVRRYELMTTTGERHTQTQILLRFVDECERLVPHSAADKRPRESGAITAPPSSVTDQSKANPPRQKRTNGALKPDVSPAIGDPSTEALMPAQEESSTPTKIGKSAPPTTPGTITLSTPIAEALRMRPQEAGRLSKVGLHTLNDGLMYLPREHMDFGAPLTINRFAPGLKTTLIGVLRDVRTARIGTTKKVQIVEAKVADATGVISARWFNQIYIGKLLQPHIGQRIAISGQVAVFNGKLQFEPLDFEFPDEDTLTHTSRMVPIYPLTEGLTQHWLRGIQKRIVDLASPLIIDPLPSILRQDYQLPDLPRAVQTYHFPATPEEAAIAQRRLAFDELFYISLGMLRRKRETQVAEATSGRPIVAPGALEEFLAVLPFKLTGAQQRAIAVILADMGRPLPMNRLLQGDVGAGKTVVATAAALIAARAGFQSVIMAPTEILAEQHARGIGNLLAPFDIPVGLLTGSLGKAARTAAYEGAADGTLPVLVGTHALIQEEVEFHRLGLAVIDEQHRFGVVQRARLRGKGTDGGQQPHVLVMTATPIPRTLALTMYGDLDVTALDERPPGRQPIETRWLPSPTNAYNLVREQVALGRQAFVVCPMIEENESFPARAAVAEQKKLQEKVFPDLRVGLVHGKMKPAEKDETLRRFRDKDMDILVATSVIEVGIDIPNATVMVIQDANRFGLAQLHQFRGRVGRGAERSYCVLLADEVSAVGQQRLSAITRTDDGFALAEEDLKLRGAGEFWGTRQSGLPDLRVARLGDARLIEEARLAAERLIAIDPDLTHTQHALLKQHLNEFWRNGSEHS